MKIDIQKTAQKAVVVSEKGEILLGRYLESKYLPEKLNGKYCLPGGQINPGEDPDLALAREVEEETGILIEPGPPFYIWSWNYEKDGKGKQIVAVARVAKRVGGELKGPSDEPDEGIKMDAPRWVSLDSFDLNLMVVDEAPVIESYLRSKKENPFL